MSVALLDVNVLIALAWPTHVHHRDARTWFSQNRSAGWATCPITQCAFVRLSSNSKILPDAVEPLEAIVLLNQITAVDNHVFWQDSISITANAVRKEMLVSHRQVIDSYLLGLAIHFNGRLVTFDRGMDALLPRASEHRKHLEILQSA